MSNILVLNSSLAGEESVSRRLVAEITDRLVAADPAARVVRRDLAADPIPHLSPATVAGVRAQPTTAAERQARALSDTLIAELRAADVIVLGVPMYNFGVPTTFRAWYDHVARAGETFSYSAEGPKGLLEGKRVIVAESTGGLYSEGAAKAADFQEPYLRQLLGFIGLTDVEFVRAEKIGFGPEAREQSVGGAIRRIGEITRALKAA